MQASGVALGGPALSPAMIPACIAHVGSGPICHEALMTATARGCDLHHTKDQAVGKEGANSGSVMFIQEPIIAPSIGHIWLSILNLCFSLWSSDCISAQL